MYVDKLQIFEFKLDIGRRRLPSPDVKKPEQERAPEFVIRPRRQFVDGGQSAKFKVSFEGSPSTQLSWSKDGQSLSSSSKYKMYEQDGYHYLEIQNVHSDDSGMYVCTIENSAGTDAASAELDVFAKPKLLTRNTPAPPVLVIPLKDVEATVGEHNVRLECKVQDADESEVTWFHNGKEVQPSSHYRIRFTGAIASLVVLEAEEDDSGLYECVLSSGGGEIRTSCSLFVTAGENPEPPAFTQELHDTEVENGDKVELVAEVKEVEKPQPPEFLTRPIHLTIEEGSNATFTCCVSGHPSPTIWWEHNGYKLSQSKRLQISDDGQIHTLEIVGTNKSDSGQYMCHAENSAGLVIHTCSLVISHSKFTQPHGTDSLKAREPLDQMGEQNSQESGRSYNAHDFRNVLRKSCVMIPQPGTNSTNPKLTTSAGPTHSALTGCSISIGTTKKNLDLFESMSSTEQIKPTSRQQFQTNQRRFQRGQLMVGDNSLVRSSVLLTQAPYPARNWTDKNAHQTKLSSNQPMNDFRSVLKRQRTTHRNTGMFTNSNVRSRASFSKRSENRKNGLESNSIGALRKDFRSILKEHKDGRTSLSTELKSTPQHKNATLKTEVQEDFRSVLEKKRNRAEERKHLNPPLSVVSKVSTEKNSNINISTDVNSLKSKFESHPQDVKNFHLKPTRDTPPELINHSKLETESVKTTAEWKVNNADPARIEPSTFKPLSEGLSALSRVKKETPRTSDYSSASDISQDTDISQTPDILQSVDATLKRRWLEERETDIGNSSITSCLAPSIIHPLENQRARYGGKAVFKCKILGDPEPVLRWSVNHKVIKPSKFFQLSYEESFAQLVISEAFSEDEGEYTCTATNLSGTVSSSCYLTVESSSSSKSEGRAFEGPVSMPPYITSLVPQNIAVQRGQPVRLTLTFASEPAPSIRWFQSKKELIADHQGASICTLMIDAVSRSDTGCYTVTVTNDLGTDHASADITVQDVPDPPVGKPHFYDISRESVSLSWCGPAYDGGSQVTHYAIEVQEVSEGTWSTLTSDCRSTSYYASNLKPDCFYQFRVRAGNKLGLSRPSEISDIVQPLDFWLSPSEYESDGPSEVFSPTVEYLGRDSLPFEHKQVKICLSRKFEDHYELLHEVGKGKFGNVYKCLEKSTNSVWAAKVVKCREKDKENVRREVDIMNRLAHPKLLMLWDAYETHNTVVLVMEYVGAGELFERVIREDFVLTERDCVHFMRQICSGVSYMHSQSILHLDLKPENVLCVAENSNQIKIIDFGLARVYRPGESIRVLYGTPEFIAPEVINYDEVDFSTDLWSVGVICYILLSGLSPFLGDNDAETLANVTSGEYDFDEEPFKDISENAKDFICRLLIKRKERRDTIEQCLQHPWLAQEDQRIRCKRLNTERLRDFLARRKWQKTGNAIRALGRMASIRKMLLEGFSLSSSAITSHSPDSDSSSQPVLTPKHIFSSPAKVVDEEETLEGEGKDNGKAGDHDDDDIFMRPASSRGKDQAVSATRHSKNPERTSGLGAPAFPEELPVSSFRRRPLKDAEPDPKPSSTRREPRLTRKPELLEEEKCDVVVPEKAGNLTASRLPGTQSKDSTKKSAIPGTGSVLATGDTALPPSTDLAVAAGDSEAAASHNKEPAAGVKRAVASHSRDSPLTTPGDDARRRRTSSKRWWTVRPWWAMSFASMSAWRVRNPRGWSGCSRTRRWWRTSDIVWSQEVADSAR
ncbi:hypothetical protein C0Q70_00726 [Pomacea canaliculata]|uniref:Myosin light chain kinase, smooth muscle n=1 Tax=Pomacea canaliculata TaxID=400727 RepID=A0A2T7PXG2_POMCA|nr:hypothetical protein C0Q70_00726 [Pomacea canaliculata]